MVFGNLLESWTPQLSFGLDFLHYLGVHQGGLGMKHGPFGLTQMERCVKRCVTNVKNIMQTLFHLMVRLQNPLAINQFH
jgi:hypothetical protein